MIFQSCLRVIFWLMTYMSDSNYKIMYYSQFIITCICTTQLIQIQQYFEIITLRWAGPIFANYKILQLVRWDVISLVHVYNWVAASHCKTIHVFVICLWPPVYIWRKYC